MCNSALIRFIEGGNIKYSKMLFNHTKCVLGIVKLTRKCMHIKLIMISTIIPIQHPAMMPKLLSICRAADSRHDAGWKESVKKQTNKQEFYWNVHKNVKFTVHKRGFLLRPEVITHIVLRITPRGYSRINLTLRRFSTVGRTSEMWLQKENKLTKHKTHLSCQCRIPEKKEKVVELYCVEGFIYFRIFIIIYFSPAEHPTIVRHIRLRAFKIPSYLYHALKSSITRLLVYPTWFFRSMEISNVLDTTLHYSNRAGLN